MTSGVFFTFPALAGFTLVVFAFGVYTGWRFFSPRKKVPNANP